MLPGVLVIINGKLRLQDFRKVEIEDSIRTGALNWT